MKPMKCKYTKYSLVTAFHRAFKLKGTIKDVIWIKTHADVFF